MYRYWAIGWAIYSAGAFWGVLLSSEALVITDIFSISGIFIGGTFIIGGSRGRELTRNRASHYVFGNIIFLALLIMGLTFSWPFYFVFTPLGVYIVFACFLMGRNVYNIPESIGQPRIWLLSGLTLWGFSWLSFPLIAIFPEYYPMFMVIQAVGVIVSGASMMTLFIRTVNDDLQRQYKVTQIMSSLVQHDIRNYIQVAKLALELTENSGLVNNHWIEVASQSLDGARKFVDEMREMASILTRFRPEPKPIQLRALVDSIKQRVVSEYSIQPDQIKIEVPEETVVLACRLSSELLWNIFDNAFKHGSESILVKEVIAGQHNVVLEIDDKAGGLPDEIKKFLNGSESISEENAPGVGLGIILIHSLSQMCKSKIHVDDIVEGSKVIGTKFTLNYRSTKFDS